MNTSLVNVCHEANFTRVTHVYVVMPNDLNVMKSDTFSQSVILLFVLLQLMLDFLIPILLSGVFSVIIYFFHDFKKQY